MGTHRFFGGWLSQSLNSCMPRKRCYPWPVFKLATVRMTPYSTWPLRPPFPKNRKKIVCITIVSNMTRHKTISIEKIVPKKEIFIFICFIKKTCSCYLGLVQDQRWQTMLKSNISFSTLGRNLLVTYSVNILKLAYKLSYSFTKLC